MKIYGVKVQIDRTLKVESEDIQKETAQRYFLTGELWSYGYRRMIDKTEAHLTPSAAIEAFIRDQEEKSAFHKDEVVRLEALIAAAQSLISEGA